MVNEVHGNDREQPPPVPAWVKRLGLGLLVAAVATVLAILLIGGEHGPGRHSGMVALGVSQVVPMCGGG